MEQVLHLRWQWQEGGSQPWQCPQELKQSGWGTFRLGTSGYVYKHWKKVVYEEGISQKQWFQLYTRLFDTVEINNSFYRLPAPQVFEGWRDQAPQGFCYSLKFSRWFTQVVTHKPAHMILLLLFPTWTFVPNHAQGWIRLDFVAILCTLYCVRGVVHAVRSEVVECCIRIQQRP